MNSRCLGVVIHKLFQGVGREILLVLGEECHLAKTGWDESEFLWEWRLKNTLIAMRLPLRMIQKTLIKHDVHHVDHVPCLLCVSNSTFPLTSNLYSSWLLLLEANAMPRWNFRFNWEKGAFFSPRYLMLMSRPPPKNPSPVTRTPT